MRKSQPLEVEGRAVPVSNLDKVLYPAANFTKGQVIQYYVRAAPLLLPHLSARPVTLKRYPNGVRGEHFYEKDAPAFTPEWVRTYPVPRRDGGPDIRYIVIGDLPTLVWSANLANLEIHPFLHRVPEIDAPLAVVFDLDPGEGAGVLDCADVAFRVRAVMDRLGLECCAKVSGSKGIQVYVPLNSGASYAATQPFAKAVAQLLEREEPGRIVSEMAKSARKGKVFIDWSQNADFKTTVGVYSLRAKRDRPYVSAPVTWDELRRALKKKDEDALYWEPDAALARFEKVGDLFAAVLTRKQRLPEAVLATVGAGIPAARSKRAARTPEAVPRRSRQGGRRRFAARQRGGTWELLLETRGKLKRWTLPLGLPESPGAVRPAAAAGEVPLRGFEPDGVYELIEGTLDGGSLFFEGGALRGERLISRERLANLAGLPETAAAFVEPMMARLAGGIPEGDPWRYELKFDGYRALVVKNAGEVTLYSRRRNVWNSRYPPIAEAFRDLEDGTVVDGEVVALDEEGRPSFNRLQSHEPSQPVYFYAFDLPAYRGRSLEAVPLEDRREMLRGFALARLADPVRYSETLEAPAADLIVAARERGLEGLVAKRRGSLYEPGARGGAWVKYKVNRGQELVIGGYMPGKNRFDSLLAGYYEGGRLLFVAKIKNGFLPRSKEQVFRRFQGLETGVCPFANLPEPKNARRGEALTAEVMKKCRWLKPELVAQVNFTEWTAANHLRHSSFAGLRDDRDPREVRRETAL